MEREVDLTDQRPHVSDKGSVLLSHGEKRFELTWPASQDLL
jgi:hypothetical protein